MIIIVTIREDFIQEFIRPCVTGDHLLEVQKLIEVISFKVVEIAHNEKPCVRIFAAKCIDTFNNIFT
jgi:hypothetical protein